jgi:hypothetical protein
MIVRCKPMLDKVDNNILLFNETMVYIYLHHLLCLTDFMVDHDKRELIARSLLFIVVFTVIVNLVKFLLVCDWCLFIRKIKKKFYKNNKSEIKIKKFDGPIDLNGKTNIS